MQVLPWIVCGAISACFIFSTSLAGPSIWKHRALPPPGTSPTPPQRVHNSTELLCRLGSSSCSCSHHVDPGLYYHSRDGHRQPWPAFLYAGAAGEVPKHTAGHGPRHRAPQPPAVHSLHPERRHGPGSVSVSCACSTSTAHASRPAVCGFPAVLTHGAGAGCAPTVYRCLTLFIVAGRNGPSTQQCTSATSTMLSAPSSAATNM